MTTKLKPLNIRLSEDLRGRIDRVSIEMSERDGGSPKDFSKTVRHLIVTGLEVTEKQLAEYARMSNNKYDLQVCSLGKDSSGRVFKRYLLGGTPTMGVVAGEPYEVRFYNKTSATVQVRLTIDGTDILTGEKGKTSPEGKMWVVRPYGNLILKAWPEDRNGGAEFVFVDDAGKTVAAHTHGDTSHRGVIAAAVFTEGYTPPPVVLNPIWWPAQAIYPSYPSYPGDFVIGGGGWRGSSVGCDTLYGSGGYASAPYPTTMCSNEASIRTNSSAPTPTSVNCSVPFQSAGTGAGERVAQHIADTTGLVQPVLAQVLKLRYMLWNNLEAALRAAGNVQEFKGFVQEEVPSGFPGDPFQGINLKSTPRPAFQRFI